MTEDTLLAGSRTVLQLATHFCELKEKVHQMLDTGRARQRGYFTPTEEEACQHLLISYWHSRNALLDLVLSLRAQAGTSDASFLVGYAGALLLVDAARFLREIGDDAPMVRKKLNEPSPVFGIPQGVYDTVQCSLTSPITAWRLFQATEMFDVHETRLRQAAESESLLPILKIIDDHIHRVRVPAARYIPARFRVRTRQGVNVVTQDLLGRMLYRLQRLVSEMASHISVCPSHRPRLPEQVTAELRSLMQPGDIFVTRKEFALTNYFLPGYWPHAALYMGEVPQLEQRQVHRHEHARPRWERLCQVDPQQPGRVVEALRDGVWIRSVSSPFSSDSVVVLRPQLSPAEIDVALGRALAHDGKPYDFDFDFTRSDRLVCTEVVYRAYDGVQGMSFPLKRRAGRLTLAAGDLIEMALNRMQLQVLAVYLPNDGSPLLLRDHAAEDAIGERLPS